MQQYFIEDLINLHQIYQLDANDSHHIQNVMRKQIGDYIRISDQNRIYCAKIIEFSPVKVFVEEVLKDNREIEEEIILIMSLIKANQFELVLQKATELGVSKIVPYQAQRSVVKVNKKYDKKMLRYRRILTEAAEQSERTIIPKLVEPIQLSEVSNYLSEQNFLLYEREEGNHLLNQVKATNSTLIIGPEGGFTKQELTSLQEFGFKKASLGKRILRAETAAIAAVTLVSGVCEYEE